MAEILVCSSELATGLKNVKGSKSSSQKMPRPYRVATSNVSLLDAIVIASIMLPKL